MQGEKSIGMCCNVFIFHIRMVALNNAKRKEAGDIQVLQIVREPNDEPTTPQDADTIACKVGKEWDFSWSYLYQLFTHEDYPNISYNKVL